MADVQTELSAWTGEPPRPRSPNEARAALWRLVWVGSWCVVAGGVWLTISRAFGITRPVVTVAGQAVTPLVYFAVWPAVALAVWKRRWLLAGVSALLVVVHVAVVLPAVWPHDTPAWAAAAPHVTLVSANVRIDNPTPERTAEALLAADADVLVVVEVTPPFISRLQNLGVYDRYAYRLERPVRWDGRGVAIYSKKPFTEITSIDLGGRQAPGVRVDTGNGTHLDVYGVHDVAPYESDRTGRWIDNLAALRRAAPTLPQPFVLTGDFNATRWHPPFEKLLDAGLTDSHEQTGHGLSFSWPADRFFPPIFRLDHALTSDGVIATSLHDITLPGSDHRGFEVTLAVRA